jgi:hypothetical protein
MADGRQLTGTLLAFDKVREYKNPLCSHLKLTPNSNST